MQNNHVRALCGLFCMISMIGLGGCGWLIGEEGLIKDRKNEYRRAEVTRRIEVPDTLDQSAISDLYMVPDVEKRASADVDFEIPRPDAIVTSKEGAVRAFKSENRYWISLNGTPAQVWARVRRFWEINGIQLERENPFGGIMESIWLSRERDDKKTNDKFHVRVEHGMRENSSEVHLMHLSYPISEELPETPDWTEVKAGDEIAVAVMQEIASFLIDTEYEGGSASLLAQSFLGSPKSSLSTNAAGNKIILLKLDYNRAWIAVGKSIEDSDLELEDLDRSAGIYYINYFPEASSDNDSGWFSFLKFGKSEKKGKAYKFTVKLNEMSGKVEVAVARDDEASDQDLSEAILAKIRDNLV